MPGFDQQAQEHLAHALKAEARRLGIEACGIARATRLDDENIVVHAVPRAQAPAWLMRKRAEGYELDLKLWAGLWMIDHNPDGSPAD